ncbi:MAG: hypothetical protein JWR05_2877 [Mucilaginibacter sp.]|nr:hypothetical protein [Mucilaginibacter sp.]
MEQLIPIPTLHLFKVLDELLVELLTSLSPDDWNKPTLAKLWKVKDIAAHLLDGNVRDIALLHNYENNQQLPQINSYQDLVNYLNELNAVWVNAMKRMSPQLLIQQLKATGPQYIEYLHTLDPFKPAKHSVAWAGEEQSLNWFHIAREYTEKWHHQQQIREAVNKPALMTTQLFYPCIATFMCALPHAYTNIPAQTGTIISFTISGEAGGTWILKKSDSVWGFKDDVSVSKPAVHITIRPDIAWKLFTKAISPSTAIENSIIQGDNYLAAGIFNMVTVMA